jgi:glycosyltransferase involved in cell wall biosynthesis
MAKLLFVVHRYYPYSGGSEYFTHDMAREASKRGHLCTVLTHEHKGNIGEIKVTSDYNVLVNQMWDLIIVHGGDCVSQNIVHANAYNIPSPVLYMIIKPSDSPVCMNGLKHHKYLGYSTYIDIQHLKFNSVLPKGRRVRHGITYQGNMYNRDDGKIINDKTQARFKNNHGIKTKRMFVSAGGFYPHKQMIPLAFAFQKANIPDTTLCLFGYGDGPQPQDTQNIRVFAGLEKNVVHGAIFDADLYIMHSAEEGFGLVLLESMLYETPWAATHVGGAPDMKEYGFVYRSDDELINYLQNFQRNKEQVKSAFEYVQTNHMIKNTMDDIEDILRERK